MDGETWTSKFQHGLGTSFVVVTRGFPYMNRINESCRVSHLILPIAGYSSELVASAAITREHSKAAVLGRIR